MPAAFPLPELDNTLLTPTTWVYSLKLPLRAHSLLLAIIQRMNWDTGKGCWASVESLAEDARLSLREAARQIRWLADHGIIGRKRRRDASAETWLIMAREGEQISLPNLDTERVRSATGGRLTNSSSTNQLNQKVPGLVDASKVDDSGPETRVLNSFSFEEERTGTGTVDYQAWVDSHLSEVPTDSEIEQLGKHCWPEWGPHWGGGWAGILADLTAQAEGLLSPEDFARAYVSLADLGRICGVSSKSFREWLKYHGWKFQKRRSPANGRWAHYVTVKDAKAVIEARR